MLPHGRAQVDPESPRSFGICDRCGFLYNHYNLRWQFDYRGNKLANLRFLVCDVCLDDPQPQLKPKILTPDPLPVLNARPENYAIDEADYLVTNTGSLLVTNSGDNMVMNQ